MFLLAIGLAFSAVGIFLYRLLIDLINKGERVPGTIVSLERNTGERAIRYTTIEFTTKSGKSRQIAPGLSLNGKKGGKIYVLYHPENNWLAVIVVKL